jgi:Protein of unknown function (DUF2946)
MVQGLWDDPFDVHEGHLRTMSRRAIQRRFVAWLAIAAMALVAFAPGISQYLVAVHAMSSVDALCPEHAVLAHQGHSDHGSPDKPSGEHGDACGYCTLLSHSPVTPTVFRLATIAMPVHADAPIRVSAIHSDAAVILSAEPRGPPVFSIG